METSPTGLSAPEPEKGETAIGIAATGTGGGLFAQGCPSRRLLPEVVVGDDEERLPLPEGGGVGLRGGPWLPHSPQGLGQFEAIPISLALCFEDPCSPASCTLKPGFRSGTCGRGVPQRQGGSWGGPSCLS